MMAKRKKMQIESATIAGVRLGFCFGRIGGVEGNITKSKLRSYAPGWRPTGKSGCYNCLPPLYLQGRLEFPQTLTGALGRFGFTSQTINATMTTTGINGTRNRPRKMSGPDCVLTSPLMEAF